MTDLPTSLGLTMPAPKPLRIHAAQGLHPVAEGTGFAALFASALPRPPAPLAAGDTADIDEAEIEGLDAVSHESEAVAAPVVPETAPSDTGIEALPLSAGLPPARDDGIPAADKAFPESASKTRTGRAEPDLSEQPRRPSSAASEATPRPALSSTASQARGEAALASARSGSSAEGPQARATVPFTAPEVPAQPIPRDSPRRPSALTAPPSPEVAWVEKHAARAQPAPAPTPGAARATARSGTPPGLQELQASLSRAEAPDQAVPRATQPTESATNPARPAPPAPPFVASFTPAASAAQVRSATPTPAADTPVFVPDTAATPPRGPASPRAALLASNRSQVTAPAAAMVRAQPAAEATTPFAELAAFRPGTTAPADPLPGPAPSADLPARAVTEQVARVAARLSVEARPGVTEVVLSPEELGRVRISLSGTEGSLQVVVTAERAETLDLLRRHAALLSEDLAALGYDGAALEFGHGRGQSGSPADVPEARDDPAPTEGTALPNLAATAALDAPRNPASGRIDIRL